jgi:hypothetical protein
MLQTSAPAALVGHVGGRGQVSRKLDPGTVVVVVVAVVVVVVVVVVDVVDVVVGGVTLAAWMTFQ